MLYGLINFGTFLTGVVFGILICGVALFHVLVSTKPHDKDDDDSLLVTKKDQNKDSNLPIGLTQHDVNRLNSIIDYLDEVSSPLKSMGTILQKIQGNKDAENGTIDLKMKTIVDLVTLSKLEKEHQDNVSELKDHAKQIKLLSSFLNDMTKAVSSFSKDLNKLASTAKSNMHRNSVIETKEDMIVNAWWQSLQIAMDHLASDQEELASLVTDQLQNVSQQLQEEIGLIEKRLNAEGSRYFSSLRENIQMFEAKLRERDKYKDKMRTASITGTAASLLSSASEQHQKRQQRLKQAEEALVLQTRKLYEAQRDFYLLLPRIASDVQLTVLKSIIETQAQLLRLADGIERAQGNSKSVCRRLRAQLTNAAGSLVQMINSDSRLLPDQATNSADGDSVVGNNSLALDIMLQRQQDRQRERGVKGYEITLQRVLEGLLLQAHPRKEQSAGTEQERIDEADRLHQQGRLDMFSESTACLAANNPTLLPDLPRNFGNHAIGLETCVWFNAFCGRVYRDMAESAYFNAWFRAKLAAMLNKGKRPGYVDAFEVSSLKFGDQPPLLMNVKWFPPPMKRKRRPGANAGVGQSSKSAQNNTNNPDTNDSDDSDDEDVAGGVKMSGADNENEGENEGENDGDPTAPPDGNEYGDDNSHYYAACNADIVFRSGLQFTVATRVWLNWPRDRYASVPIFIHLDLSELQGRVRFGVKRSHSFLSFLKDPLTRISVRSEVGSDRLKLRDIPQVSDFIVRKLKSFIHRKIVHPHAHKFRLIWPRNWWPEGTEHLFTSTTTVPGATSVPETSTPVDTTSLPIQKKESEKVVGADMACQTDIMALGVPDRDLDDMMREAFVDTSYASVIGINNNINNTVNSGAGSSPEPKSSTSSRRPSVAPLPNATILNPTVSVTSAENVQTASHRMERARSMSINPPTVNTQAISSASSVNSAVSTSAAAVGSDSSPPIVPNVTNVAAAVSDGHSSSGTPAKSVNTSTLTLSQQQQQDTQWKGHLRRVANRLQQQWQSQQQEESESESDSDDESSTEKNGPDDDTDVANGDEDQVVHRRLTPRLAEIGDEMEKYRLTLTQPPAAAATVSQPLDDRSAALHMRHCYRKYQDGHRASGSSEGYLLGVDRDDSGSHNDSSAGYPLFLHQQLLHPNRRPRAMSLSEFRPEVLTVLLEDVLEHRDLQISPEEVTGANTTTHSSVEGGVGGYVEDENDRNRGKLLVGFRRARRTASQIKSSSHRQTAGQSNKANKTDHTHVRRSSKPGRTNAGQGHAPPSATSTGISRQRTSTVTGAEFMYQPNLFSSGQRNVSSNPIQAMKRSSTGTASVSRNAAIEEDQDNAEDDALDAAAKWLKSRGKEGMEKAKAKFRQFTSKHFSNSNQDSNAAVSAVNAAHGHTSHTQTSSNHGVSSSSHSQSSSVLSSSPGMLTKLERRLSGKDVFAASSASASVNSQQSSVSAGHSQHRSSFTSGSVKEGSGSESTTPNSMKSLVTSIFRDNNRDRDRDSLHGAPAEDATHVTGNHTSGRVNSMFSKALSSVRQHMQEARNGLNESTHNEK